MKEKERMRKYQRLEDTKETQLKTYCGLLDWILEQKKSMKEKKLVKFGKVCSSVNNNVPVLISWFYSLYYGYVSC